MVQPVVKVDEAYLFFKIKKKKNFSGPGQVAQLFGVSSQSTEVAGSIPSRGTQELTNNV